MSLSYYKMFVDWNGDVLFCSNDWGREIVIGNLIEFSYGCLVGIDEKSS